ncbi:mechanosensitive ion channel family protein [Natrialbaceae archaeon AArc-T1-2]|uniref:mechanosensitive ion channel family protein n=1 Tax=Natrialbaceae archaeon AArc-T1-2 TaxID=3053904 RepID=UPI00255AC2E0|nr:mechanosensitive ion channel family protein [Natrialbaceae archaeon AArc-T1-2]WIV66732.1 mechanosensitive ion channel family protein [Natrialbaceae archaeon AArc-T1-2]
MGRLILQTVNETGDELGDEIESLLPYSPPGWLVDLGLAIAVLVAGWYLSKLVVRLTGRTVAQRIDRPSVTRTVLRGVRISVLILAVLVAADVLVGIGGVEILLSVTVISAVVGVVLAPLVASLINGFFILTDRPFEIGDMIEIVDEGHRGFVEDITIRYTKVFTLDNTFIVVPNSEIHERDVINYSAEDERTRVSVQFEVTYESDVETARKLAERAARNVDTVISGGPDIRIGSARYGAAPTCLIEEYGEDGILLTLRFWIKHPFRLLAVRSAVQERIRKRYADADVEFAYPHRHHVFDETSGRARVGVASPLEANGPPPDPEDERE